MLAVPLRPSAVPLCPSAVPPRPSSVPPRPSAVPPRPSAAGPSDSAFWSAMDDIPAPDDLPGDAVAEHIPAQRAPEETKDGLDERELQILAFEGRWWKHAGS